MEGGFDLAEVFAQGLLKVIHGCLGGGAGKAVFDFIAYPVGRRILQFADIEAPVMVQLIDNGFRGNHPAPLIGPYVIEEGDGVHDDAGSGIPCKPLVMSDLEVGIPVQEQFQGGVQFIGVNQRLAYGRLV